MERIRYSTQPNFSYVFTLQNRNNELIWKFMTGDNAANITATNTCRNIKQLSVSFIKKTESSEQTTYAITHFYNWKQTSK